MWRVIISLFFSSLFWANASTDHTYKILTADPGIYRVFYEDLSKASPMPDGLKSTALNLSYLGQPLPIFVEDGGDGIFGPKDYFEFQAKVLRGELGYYHEYTHTNAFFLALNATTPVRMTHQNLTQTYASRLPSKGRGAFYRSQQHLETDTLLMRFRSKKNEPHEIWYWKKLACNDAEPFEVPIDLPDIDTHLGGQVKLKVQLRGWSQISGNKHGIPDHVIQVLLNGEPIDKASWGGKDIHTIALDNIPANKWRVGNNTLGLHIPARHQDGGKLIVDVSILNWISIDYPKSPVFQKGQNPKFDVAPQHQGRDLQLFADSNSSLFLFTDQQQRFKLTSPLSKKGPVEIFGLPKELGVTSFYALNSKSFLKPNAILPVVENDLVYPAESVDYIMLTHPRLQEAVSPLADIHRKRGLSVKLVDIRDVYDRFNHGILHPKAIRDFLRHAQQNWPKPAPKFVLLVGDASWDTKNATVKDENYPDLTYYPRFRTEFNKILSTPYKDVEKNNRNLIPTMMFFDKTGHSASDNSLVCLDDDIKPDMAIGRLPVTEPAEVRAIVNKTIAYMNDSQVGPWRRNVLYITNEDQHFQKQTSKIASQMSDKGMVTHRIYPDSSEKSNEKHTEVILNALDQGQYMVYFFGHGGRYIWRTGPPDFRKNHDLFTLKDLDKLANNPKLPIIVSFTCFSAPFDHPGADSIGEKFLRIDQKGAVAFFGASWRNWPNYKMATETMSALTLAPTLGEAIQISKNKIYSPTLIQTYNLLGDPALPLRKNPSPLDITVTPQDNQLTVGFPIGKDLMGGSYLVEVLNKVGEPLETAKGTINAKEMQLKLAQQTEQELRVQVYLWHDQKNLDALGLVPLPSAEQAGSGKASMP